MKTIRFKLNGLLMAVDFKEDANIEVEAEKMLRHKVSFIENTYDCSIVNNTLLDIVLETAMPDDELEEGFTERHIGYELEIEKRIYSSLRKKDILDLIQDMDLKINRDLSLMIGAIKFIPEESERDFDYEYDIVSESLLFSEEEFVNTICENINNPYIEKLSLEIAGFDYSKDGLNLEDVLSDRYKELRPYSIVDFAKNIMIELEKNSDTKYYELSFYHNKPTEKSLELYGEGGISLYFKTDFELSKKDIFDKCIKYTSYKELSNVYEAAYYMDDDILEISSEEFYNSTY